MTMLATATGNIIRSIPAANIADRGAAFHLQKALDMPSEAVRFDVFAPAFLQLAMSRSIAELGIQALVAQAAAFTIALQVKERQAGVPAGPATEAYLAQLNGLIAGLNMNTVTRHSFSLLKLSEPTSCFGEDGERLDGASFDFPTPAGTVVIDHVVDHYSDARHINLILISMTPAAPSDITKVETPNQAMLWILEQLRAVDAAYASRDQAVPA